MRVRLVGLTCTHVPEDDLLTLQAALAGAPGDDLFTILMYHSPDLAPEAAGAGIDLQVSGHTHGGQVRVPGLGALVTSSLHGKRFEMGAYQLGDMLLYVARGIGLEGQGAPRARFLCEPEVVLWELDPEPDVSSSA
jgi:predicted MPP superfamily phosphohydrolase